MSGVEMPGAPTPTIKTPPRPNTSFCDACGECDEFCPSGGGGGLGGGSGGSSGDLLCCIGVVLPIVVVVSFILAVPFWRSVNTRCEVLDIGCYEDSVAKATDDINAKSRVNSSSVCDIKKGKGSLRLDVEYENSDGKELEGGLVIRGPTAKKVNIFVGKSVKCHYSKSDEKDVDYGNLSAEPAVFFFISLFFLIMYVAFVQLTSKFFSFIFCEDGDGNSSQNSVDPGASNADTVPPNGVPSSNPPDAQMMDATRRSDTGLLSGRPDGLASLGAPRPQMSARAAPSAPASTPPAPAQSITASKSGFEGVSMDAVNIRGLGNVSERSAGSSSGGGVDEGEASAPSAAAPRLATDSAATTTAESGGSGGDGIGAGKASAVEKGKADALAQASNMFKGGFGKR